MPALDADLEQWKAQAVRLEAKYAELVQQVRVQTEQVDRLLQVYEEAVRVWRLVVF